MQQQFKQVSKIATESAEKFTLIPVNCKLFILIDFINGLNHWKKTSNHQK